MPELLGQAVLELRTDDTGLNAGMAKAKAGAQDLGNTFNVAGQRAGSSLSGLSVSATAAGAAATRMAAGAQLSARAAAGLAGDARTAEVAVTGLANGSALATRELLVLVREASRGNFTRMAGSASILTASLQGSGQSVKGIVTGLLTMFGILRTTTDAELAAEAAAAAAGAESVGLAAKRAAANVMAADTELALAEAAVASAATSEALTAAQAQLAGAHVAVAAAAQGASVAEIALAQAQGRAAAAGEAVASTSVTSLTTLGIVLGVATAGAFVAYGAFKAFQMQVGESGDLNKFAEGLRLTTDQIEKAGGKVKYLGDRTQEISGLTVTMGDVVRGVWKTIADHTGLDSSMDGLKKFFIDQFEDLLKAGVDTFAELYGDIVGTYRAAILIWQNFPAALGDVFYSAVNTAIAAIDDLLKSSTDGVNGFIDAVNKKLGTSIGDISAPQIAQVSNQYAGAAKKVLNAVGDEIAKATAEAKKNANALVAEADRNMLDAAKKRLQDKSDSNRPPKAKAPKKPKRNAADDELSKLDAEIRGQSALADAYLTSDAAAVKAEADAKALVLAEEKHATAAQTAALKEKELALAVAQGSADGAKKVASLRDEADARQSVNDEVAAGLVPTAQMQQQLQLETELRPFLVIYSLAEGDAKKRLAAVIADLTNEQAKLNAENSRAQALQDEQSNNDDVERLKLEVSLAGESNRQRAIALAQLQAEQKLRTMPGLSPADQQKYIQSYVDAANAAIKTPWQEFADSIPRTAAAISDALGSIEAGGLKDFNDGLASAIVNSTSLGQVFHNVAAQMLQDLIKLALQEAEMAIFKAVAGAAGGSGSGGGGGSGSGLSSIFGGYHAGGGLIPAGTFGIVGERGPEPVIATPHGAMVLPNSTLRSGVAANSNSVNVTNYNDFRGADPAAVGAINQRVDQLEQDLPGRVFTTMQDARQRFMWRG